MQALLAEYLSLLDQPDASAADVSAWSVHQHAEHVAVATDYFLSFIDRLHDGEGSPGGGPRFLGRVLLRTGFIPRGRGDAPEFVFPAGRKDVRALLEGARDRFGALGPNTSRNRLPHPFLGAFNAKQWARFAKVHTRHHLKIIRDIRKAAASGGV